MTAQELEFENKKDRMRLQAVDKEVQRLRKINRKQTRRITNLRKSLYFIAFFFISLFGVFLLRGIINFSGSKADKEYIELKKKYDLQTQKQKKLTNSIILYKDSLNSVIGQNLKNRNEEGYKFRIQIGAYKEINLNKYLTNLVAINQETYDSICQYTLGAFKDYQKAVVFWENIKKMGFNDSFIIATKNGRRIPIEQLPNDIKENNNISSYNKEENKAETAQF